MAMAMACRAALSRALIATARAVPASRAAWAAPGLPARAPLRGAAGLVAARSPRAAEGGGAPPPPLEGPPATSGGGSVDASSGSSSSSSSLRPMADIAADLAKRIPSELVSTKEGLSYVAWYQVNRILNRFAPGWSGSIVSITHGPNASVTVVYRVTIAASDGIFHRDASGTDSPGVAGGEPSIGDPVQRAESMAFRRAAARHGLGLYLYYS